MVGSSNKVKILMVCLGNICRSPLAQGILENKLDPSKFTVNSAGTANYHIGKLPDERSIAVAKNYGIDISQQRAAQFTVSDFDKYDHIFAMDKSNYADILLLAQSKEEQNKVSLILNEINTDILEVPDPYYGGSKGFENVYQLLDKACEALKNRLTN